MQLETAETPVENVEVPFEFLRSQRLYIESVIDRTRRMMPSITTFPNPNDWQTHVDMRASQEIAMSFCSVKDAYGSPLGSTVDQMATRCLAAEAGSKKQSERIEELEDENEELRRKLGQAKGSAK